MNKNSWYLVADIGGTNARFGVVDRVSGLLELIRNYGVVECSDFSATLERFLSEVGEQGNWSALPEAACLAVACAVEGDRVSFTNSPWVIDRAEVAARLHQPPVLVINAFAAVGFGVPELKAGDWVQVGGGQQRPDRPIAILGAGTGLGVCSLVPVGGDYIVLEGEGGHVDFAPVDDREIAVFRHLRGRFGRVSAERLLSGSGIENIYLALCTEDRQEPQDRSAADICARALTAGEDLAQESLEMFCRVLGGVAGNLALTLGAGGGVYIAGGIVPRFVEYFETSGFRQRFLDKGRFSSYLESVPTRIIVKENLGLLGAATKLYKMGD